MYKALVVDDESDARGVVRKLLKMFCPEISLVREAEDGPEALSLARQISFDLAFIDIQLNGEDGVDLARKVYPFCSNIVFVTAHERHALRAFQANPVHYLLKPIEPAHLRQAIARVASRNGTAKTDTPDHRKSISITTGGLTRPIVFSSIVYLRGSGNYTYFHLDTGEEIFISRGLSYYEKKVPKQQFFRAHQSYLVNLRHVSGVSHSDTMVMLSNGDGVNLARRKKKAFLRALINFR